MMSYPRESQSQTTTLPASMVSTNSGYNSDDSLATQDLPYSSHVRMHCTTAWLKLILGRLISTLHFPTTFKQTGLGQVLRHRSHRKILTPARLLTPPCSPHQCSTRPPTLRHHLQHHNQHQCRRIFSRQRRNWHIKHLFVNQTISHPGLLYAKCLFDRDAEHKIENRSVLFENEKTIK